jgi:dihydrofolate reductase
MRKVKYVVGVSLDSYIAGPDGSVDWLDRATRKAKGEDFGMAEFFKSIDTVLMGRKTYEIALKLGMNKGGYRGMKNYIFSRTQPSGERDGVEFVSGSIANFVADLKRKPGKDIWLCGGGELAREALKDGVVDEIGLGVVPMLIGGGLAAFPAGFAETELELSECKQYKGGVIGLTYTVVRATGSRRSGKAKAKSPKRKTRRA